MKILALIVSMTATMISLPVFAQNATYACQYIMQSGMHRVQEVWKTTNFLLPEPFFFTISDGLIDKKSLENSPVRISSLSGSCSKTKHDDPLIGRSHWCSDNTNYLSFSEKTLAGGLAKTMGAMQSASDPIVDSVTVSRFKCQKVG
jgi:hypothetical protein